MTDKKAKHMSNFDFKFMSFFYKIRDLYQPRSRILEDVGIKTGSKVLDYGCGPGSYVMPVIELIGDTGVLYALDIHPVAIEMVQTLTAKKGIPNVEVILSDCATGLPDASIDVVLLYDILHDLENRNEVLAELHRVLKPEGVLSVSDHHLKGEEITAGVTGGGLFKLSGRCKKTHSFAKDERD